MRLSIVIPTLNEVGEIEATLESLAPLRARGHEVVVVDGGSDDATVARAGRAADQVIVAPRGRALQMNAGTAVASGDAFLFLHADTRLPPDANDRVIDALARQPWGRFDVRLTGPHPLLRVVERMMGLRSRLTGIATGDQAMFVRRDAFFAAGRFPPIALMEDIALSRELRRLGRPACLGACVRTSSRRWERDGVLRTVARMWALRLAYRLGASPDRLARRYDPPRKAAGSTQGGS